MKEILELVEEAEAEVSKRKSKKRCTTEASSPGLEDEEEEGIEGNPRSVLPRLSSIAQTLLVVFAECGGVEDTSVRGSHEFMGQMGGIMENQP
jgi:hypothetical protein